MASGKLGAAALLANVDTTVYTVPAGIVTAFTLSIVNRGTDLAAIRVAIAPSGAPADADWIEYDVPVPGKGVLERTALVAGPGERVVVRSSTATCTARVHGFEENV